jgi:hypothetical protein
MRLLTAIFLGLVLGLAVMTGPVAFDTTSLAETQGVTIKKERVKITSTGAEGSATGTNDTEVLLTGQIVRVDVDFAAGITTTTDLTLAGANDLVSANIVNLSNTATDIVLYPHVQVTNNAGTGLTLDGTRLLTDYYPVADILTLTIAQTTAATPAVTVDIYYKE